MLSTISSPTNSHTGSPGQTPDRPKTHRSQSADRLQLSVITTCLDEEQNIDELVRRTLAMFDQIDATAELVIVDDGSRDRTWAHIAHWRQNDSRIRAARHPHNRGIEAGWRSGLEASRGALVCLIDADLQNRPEDIAGLHQAYKHHPAAVVQGTRRSTSPPWGRYLLSKGLNLLLNAIFGMRLPDNKSGFLLCRREVLYSVLQHRFAYRYYQCFLAVAAHAQGYSIHPVDTVFCPRHSGRSFLNNMPFRVIGRVLWEVLKARIEFRGKRLKVGRLKVEG